jgi:hypothetical protein
MRMRWLARLALCALFAAGASTGPAAAANANGAELLAGHAVRRDAAGHLLPWKPWAEVLRREMLYYRGAPIDHGYPRFVTETFLLEDWTPDPARRDLIPATQNGMGILSYLAWYEYTARRDAPALATARAMGDYLLKEAMTPDDGRYPRFPRSTGTRGQFPIAPDGGSQADKPFEIEPDKGGIVGYALLRLGGVTGDKRYGEGALRIAHVLAANQQAGDARRSPWPFRADWRSGEGRGPVSGNMSFILRLYDALLAQGHTEFDRPRMRLWNWVARHQLRSALGNGALFAQFFEDHDSPGNRTAWAPLNLARYLLDGREAVDPQWRPHVNALLAFVRRNFTHVEAGVRVCHEQDEDHDAWGGVNATYGAVLARYARATRAPALAQEAREVLNFVLYAVDEQGRPRDLPSHAPAGGWQEDAHTDVVHNVLDALRTWPEWADDGSRAP